MPQQKGFQNHSTQADASVRVNKGGTSQNGSADSPISSGHDFSCPQRPQRQVSISSMKENDPVEGAPGKQPLRVVVIRLLGLDQAIEVDLVEEIIMAPLVSPLIKAPFFVEGVIRLRGRIVPLVDLKKAMKLEGPFETSKESVVVIVKLWGQRIGFRVDSVLELLSVPFDSIKPPGSLLGAGVDSRFMKGMTYLGDRFLGILDIEAMFSENWEMTFSDEESLDVAKGLEQFHSSDKLSIRRIISFALDAEIFGVDMGSVAEIMELTEIMPVPNVPEMVLGLINLRGSIVPVIDLRVFFGLNRRPWTKGSRIVIMKEKTLLVGVVVDSMWESLRLSSDDFQPAPHNSSKVDSTYFKDISVINGRVVSVLDIARILSDTSGRSYSEYYSKDLLVSRPALKPGSIAEA